MPDGLTRTHVWWFGIDLIAVAVAAGAVVLLGLVWWAWS
jgi:hypothetical protein